MRERPIAYVMEQTLGNVTHYLNLRSQDSLDDGGERRWLPIDYKSGVLPWTLRGGLSARSALGAIIGDVDGIFVHTTTLAVLSVDYIHRRPTVLSTDGTPMNKRSMREAYGLKSERAVAEQAKRFLYKGIFSGAAGFVGWSNWAKRSFVEDYGCRDEDVRVIPPGVDLDRFHPGEPQDRLPRILFVGGDFERKGGDLLLDVFRKRLAGKAELLLVTRSDVPEEPGVRVHRNVGANSPELLELYRTSDLFVLPTRADCYSLVCMEALASGLPIIATLVGGIPDMIEEGVNGHGIAVDDAVRLGDLLEALLADPALRRTMGNNARETAVKCFDARENARALFAFVRSRC